MERLLSGNIIIKKEGRPSDIRYLTNVSYVTRVALIIYKFLII